MNDPTNNEISAMMKAHESAGQFLEASDTTDLAAMPYDSQMQFVEAIVTGYVDAMKAACGWSYRETEQVPY